MNIDFTKMHGLGNDFMVVNNLGQEVTMHTDVVRRLSDRNKGVGFDQLLVVEAPQDPETDFHFRIFNADGSEAEQCGNGMRCLAKYVRDEKLTWKHKIAATTIAGKIRLNLEKSGLVSVQMGAPEFVPANIPLTREEQAETYTLQTSMGAFEIRALSMGNPHALIFVDDVDNTDVPGIGAEISNHPDFPSKTNVGFIQVLDAERIKIRVFERGSAETKACGSGACAAMVAANKGGYCNNNVRVDLPGGHLFIRWAGGNKSVQMTGPATIVYKGQIRI